MKQRKSLLTLSIVGILMLMLCLAGTTVAGPGPNPSTGDEEKVVGPSPKAFLMAGWKLNEMCEENEGVLEVFIWVDDKVFIGIPEICHPENKMEMAAEEHMLEWLFPDTISQQFGFPAGTRAIIKKVSDVSDFERILDIDPLAEDPIWNPYGVPFFSYEHIVVCNVKFSFLVPK